MKLLSALVLFFLLGNTSWAQIPRPPQFVMMAFDGSYNHQRWEDTRGFARDLKKQKIDLHFTYFLSGVYFLENSRRHDYVGPHHGAGQSDIGFGGTGEEILARIGEMNSAFDEGHEMGTHYNGHFDGSKWSRTDWDGEFDVFNHLIFDVVKNNDLAPISKSPINLHFTQTTIQGARAPYLAVGPGYFGMVTDNKFLYDTSLVAASSYWPDHNRGFWNFPLAMLRIAGTGKNTLSMDYNFYVAQSNAKNDSANSAVYEKQMYETYLRYFMDNYNGNRAPVHIGHHFPLMNGGAYWRAMQHFASQVCGLPEVRCVTYKELSHFMDGLTPDTLSAYRAGKFEKTTPVQFKFDLSAPKHVDIKITQKPDKSLGLAFEGRDAGYAESSLRYLWKVQGKTVAEGTNVDAMNLNQGVKLGAQDVVTVVGVDPASNVEVLEASRNFLRSEDSSQVEMAEDVPNAALLGDLPGAHEDNGGATQEDSPVGM